MASNSKTYAGHFFKLEGEQITTKTSSFCKRNYGRGAYAYQKTSEIVSHTIASLRDFKDDSKYYAKSKKKSMEKYQRWTYREKVKTDRIRTDMIKMIPFSVLLIVPGMDLLIPAWVALFPQGLPSQFMSEEQKSKMVTKLLDHRRAAAKSLRIKIPLYFQSLIKDHAVLQKDIEGIKHLARVIRNQDTDPIELMNYKSLFRNYADLKYLDNQSLVDVSHFMGLEPITGLSTINRLSRQNFGVNSTLMKPISSFLLRRHLNQWFDKIRKDDTLLTFDMVEKFDEETLNKVCFERGISIRGCDRAEKLKDLKVWMSMSNLKNVPNSLLLVSRLYDYTLPKFENNEDLDQYEILRRCPHEIYFVEKQRVFEKTYGLDDLRKILAMKRGQYNVSKAELEMYSKVIGVFKRKQQNIQGYIQTTYQKGKVVSDYMEKKLALNHLKLKAQKEDSKEKGRVRKAAKKMIGNETYDMLDTEDADIHEKVEKKIQTMEAELEEQFASITEFIKDEQKRQRELY